jgi:S-adenosylmethionine:diacylglycerol 3-amino-3-carboxypropyl transferase
MTEAQFEATMKSVLRAAADGATLIYRSGSYRLDPPASIRPHLQPHAELARELFARDRSLTYGSFYVFSVRDGHAGTREGVARTATRRPEVSQLATATLSR